MAFGEPVKEPNVISKSSFVLRPIPLWAPALLVPSPGAKALPPLEGVVVVKPNPLPL